MAILSIDGHSLSLRDLAAVARRSRKVDLSSKAIDAMNQSAHWVEQAASGELKDASGNSEAIYGINTGFGSLARLRIPQESLGDLQRNLIVSRIWKRNEASESSFSLFRTALAPG